MDKKIVSIGADSYPEHLLGNSAVRNTKEKVKKKPADKKEEPRKSDPAVELNIYSLDAQVDQLEVLSDLELIRIRHNTFLILKTNAVEQGNLSIEQRIDGLIEKQKATIRHSQESGLY